MLRKIFTAFFLTLVLNCGAAFAGTEAEIQAEAMAEAMAAMAQQPPLGQADIDAFLDMTPKIDEVINDTQAVVKLYQDNNMTPERFGVIGAKISIGMMMSQGITAQQMLDSGQIPDFMIPDDDEMALIKANLDSITEVVNSIQ